MNIGDQIRNNYKPAQKTAVSNDLYSSLAIKQYNMATERMMASARAGQTKPRRIGLMMKKSVETTIAVNINKKTCDKPYIPTQDGEICMSIVVPDQKGCDLVCREIQNRCTADGIGFQHTTQKNGLYDATHILCLWVEV